MAKRKKNSSEPPLVDSTEQDVQGSVRKVIDRIFCDDDLETFVEKELKDGAFRGGKPFRL